MKKIIRFNIQSYSQEQNKMEILINRSNSIYNDAWVTYPLHRHVTDRFTHDHTHNIRLVRDFEKGSVKDDRLSKWVVILFKHSYEPFNSATRPKEGTYKNIKDVLHVINVFKEKNQGVKSVITGWDENRQAIYTDIENVVTATVKLTVR